MPFSTNLPQKIPAIFEKFVGEVWLRTDDFNVSSLSQRLRPLYWTQWLADSQVIGSWKAEVGYDYQVKSSQENYHHGNWHSTELLETRIRWEVRVGQIVRPYQNVSAPAYSHYAQRMSLIGDYDTRQTAAFAPSVHRSSHDPCPRFTTTRSLAVYPRVPSTRKPLLKYRQPAMRSTSAISV